MIVERYQMPFHQQIRSLTESDLVRQMMAIAHNANAYPERLRVALFQACDLIYELIDTSITNTQTFEEVSQRGDFYYAVPLFAFIARDALRQYFAEGQEQTDRVTFKDLLAGYVRQLYPADSILPVGAAYADFPFVIFRSYNLRALRAKMFNSRHLLTSQELSIVNMLLLQE
jgi:hypothetical protein